MSPIYFSYRNRHFHVVLKDTAAQFAQQGLRPDLVLEVASEQSHRKLICANDVEVISAAGDELTFGYDVIDDAHVEAELDKPLQVTKQSLERVDHGQLLALVACNVCSMNDDVVEEGWMSSGNPPLRQMT